MWRHGVLLTLVIPALVIPALVLPALLPAVAAAAEVVVVSRADCARFVEHTPAPDVAYQPGVDAQGRPVASADLDDNVTLDLDAEDIVIGIAVPLRAFPGTLGDETKFTDAGGVIDRFDATAHIGVVTVRDGSVYFNGQLVSPSERERLAAACRGR